MISRQNGRVVYSSAERAGLEDIDIKKMLREMAEEMAGAGAGFVAGLTANPALSSHVASYAVMPLAATTGTYALDEFGRYCSKRFTVADYAYRLIDKINLESPVMVTVGFALGYFAGTMLRN